SGLFRCNQRVDGSEIGLSQSGKRMAVCGDGPNQALEQPCLLDRDCHTLAMDRVEAANSIADRQQPARKFFHCFVMTPRTRGETEAVDFVDGRSLFEGV